ncbi:DUF2339 domain-containing protein [Candidatus Parcubacteria bacterium]|nr:MAG: DUF2339 domain-containing protein [Candidatus Parcubacteria bacterium]
MSILLAAIALILATVAFWWISRLERRMEQLEKAVLEVVPYARTAARFAGGRAGETSEPVPLIQESAQGGSIQKEGVTLASPLATGSTFTPIVPPVPEGALAQPKGQQKRTNRFVAWFKEEWPMKLGAALFLIGMGWFVSYAIAQGWIGVQGRLALSFLTGATLLAVGVVRIRQAWRHQGGILVVVGATTLLFTNWLAWYYELITPLASLFLIFAVVVLVGILSVVYAMRRLAIVGFLLSGFAPLLTVVAPWEPGVVPMLLYLFAVICGTLWLALFAGWMELVPATLLLVFLHYMPLWIKVWLDKMMWLGVRRLSDFEQTVSFAAALGLTGIIWLAGTIGLVGYLWNVSSHSERSRRLGYAATAFLNAFFFAFNIFIFTSGHLQSLWLAGGSALFALGAYVATRLTRDPSVFLPYGFASFALLLAALMQELEGAPLLVLTTAASAAFVLTTLRWGRTVLSVTIGVGTFLAPALVSLPIWQEAAAAPKVPWSLLDASLLALLLFVLTLGGVYLKKSEQILLTG